MLVLLMGGRFLLNKLEFRVVDLKLIPMVCLFKKMDFQLKLAQKQKTKLLLKL